MDAQTQQTMTVRWTFEQVLGLSPDHFTIRAGYGNATPNKWLFLGKQGDLVWGVFDNKKRPPFHVSLFMDEMYLSCSCSSRKFPCQHIIGLLLVLRSQTDSPFVAEAPPDWVQHNQAAAAHTWRYAPSTRLIDETSLRELQHGLGELEKWLHDLMQNGLATLPEKKKAYFETIANRMWDIQAVNLTNKLLDLANIDKTQPDWPKQCLHQLGPLALLIQGFKNFENQSLSTQADLVAATGRPLPLYTNRTPTLYDDWLVLGRRSETVASQQIVYTWLWGLKSSRLAQLEQTIRGKSPSGVCYVTGSVLQGALYFGASGWPLRARFGDKPLIQQGPVTEIGESSFRDAISSYASAKTQNPWLEQFPLVLSASLPIQNNGAWLISDPEQNVMPLVPSFNYGWHLCAMASGQPIGLFGLWNGGIFEPLSVKVDTQWIDLHTFWGIK